MKASARRPRATMSTVVGAGALRLAVGMLVASALTAGGGIGEWSEIHASRDTCGPVNQHGGEASLDARVKKAFNSRLPQSYSGKVPVGKVPATDEPVWVDVDATIRTPVKGVKVTCASSSFSARLDIRARVSGRAGRSTHDGDGKIAGLLVYAADPPKICVTGLKVTDLNLPGVQNDIDRWIRKRIHDSVIVHDICAT